MTWAPMWSKAKVSDGPQDRWSTPTEIFEPLHREFGFGLDAAAISTNRLVESYYGPDHEDPDRRNGLLRPWASPTWANPPYSLASLFAAQAQREAHENNVTSVLLLFARTDTRWWWLHVLGRDPSRPEVRHPSTTCASEIRWKPGRITFLDPETGKPKMSTPKEGSGKKPVAMPAPTPSVAIVYRGRNLDEWPSNGVLLGRKRQA